MPRFVPLSARFAFFVAGRAFPWRSCSPPALWPPAPFAVPRALCEPPAAQPGGKSLFDGKSLKGWKKTASGGEGDVEVDEGRIVMHAGSPMTGITWTEECPKIDYEISLEAMCA